jgi:hypothetical protein
LDVGWGGDKDIENGTRIGTYLTEIRLSDKNLSFNGDLHSIPKDISDYLLKGGRDLFKPIPKPKSIEIIPDYSSILIKSDACSNNQKK